jgi:FixJ family two-component response regulator
MTSPIIYVIDDDPSVRKALSRLIHSAGYEVKALVSAEDFLQQKTTTRPGCLILDLQMPGLNGLELQQALVKSNRRIPIVFVTGHADIPDSVKAMKAGAVDFLPKPFNDQVLLEAIHHALEKDRVLRKEDQEQRMVQSRTERLTPREKEVLRGVVVGKLNKQIAYQLGISEKTVKVHRGRVMEKMRVGSVADLVRLISKLSLS